MACSCCPRARLAVPRNKTGQHRWSSDADVCDLIRALARQQVDSAIAATLNRLGKRTGRGNPWTEARVRSFRSQHRVPVHRPGEMAERGEPGAVKLPRPMLNSGDLDFSFSGLKTAVLTKVREIGTPNEQQCTDIARGFQDAIVEVLVKKAMRAVRDSGMKRLVVAGGVGANRELRRQLDARAAKSGVSVDYPELEFCTDNGAMIALAGALRFQAGVSIKPAGAFAGQPRWPLAELTRRAPD